MDFGLLPPEVNSARMWSGAGAVPMLAASASWDAIAAQLSAAAAHVAAVTSGLAAVWRGPSAVAMAAAATRYQAWLTATAAQAETTAGQARLAAQAFETAFLATVPPTEVAANRALFAQLVATNLLGQNTASIMAAEAAYAEMWAQDSAAMLDYQASSAAATGGLQAPNAAPQTTTGDGTPVIGLDDGTVGGQYLQSFVSSGAATEIPLQLLSLFSSMWAVAPIASSLSAISASTATSASATRAVAAPVATAAVRAQFAIGRPVGLLRTPPGWAQSPTTSAVAPTAPLTVAEGTTTALPMPMAAGVPRGGTPPKRERPQPEYGGIVRFVPRPPPGG